MDIWLRMAWRDQRLAHQFDRPILVNDENTLKFVCGTLFQSKIHFNQIA